jgi:hypothetical protein
MEGEYCLIGQQPIRDKNDEKVLTTQMKAYNC